MKAQHHAAESVVTVRAGLLEIVAVAGGIALGVNLLATGIASRLASPTWLVPVVGAALVLTCFGYLVARTTPRINREFSFDGVLPVAEDPRQVLPIDRYELAEMAASYVRALTAENKAFATAWLENPVSEFDFDEKKGRGRLKKSPAAQLIREALEYFVLHKLSLHLSGHFENNPEIDDGEIVTIGRRDIPSVLLENRFLENFSKPMEEREAFLATGKPNVGHKVVYATGKDGAIFDHFELILPTGARVSRVAPHSVRVQTKRFSMEVAVRFEGFSAARPHRFADLYMEGEGRKLRWYEVHASITIRFKLLSLFTARGWQYYRWLDSFVDEIDSAFSFSRFLEHIGWETALSAAVIGTRLAAEQGHPALSHAVAHNGSSAE
jgi:hypothetical protein